MVRPWNISQVIIVGVWKEITMVGTTIAVVRMKKYKWNQEIIAMLNWQDMLMDGCHKEDNEGPGQCGSVVWASSSKGKGHQFDS